MAKGWYVSNVAVSYHCEYKILAENAEEARELINEAIKIQAIDPAKDDPETCMINVDVDPGLSPTNGDRVVQPKTEWKVYKI